MSETNGIGARMVVRAYPIMCRCIEEGIAYGWARAHKHTDKPHEQAIKDEIADGVINAICEYFDFPEVPGDAA